MTYEDIANLINEKHEESVTVSQETNVLYLARNWRDVAKMLFNESELDFDYLQCVTGYDVEDDTLGIAYNFHSFTHKHYVEIRIEVPKASPMVPTVSDIWSTANWQEREAYDMFGIQFDKHPNLQRILLPDDWEGYPLRKDYVTPEYYHDIKIPKEKADWE